MLSRSENAKTYLELVFQFTLVMFGTDDAKSLAVGVVDLVEGFTEQVRRIDGHLKIVSSSNITK